MSLHKNILLKGEFTMKKEALMIIINNIHNGDTVIENVLNYVLASPFAEIDRMLVNKLSTDSFDHMVQDFYKTQEPYKALEKHRRLLHIILTTGISKGMEQTLDEAAQYLLDYCIQKGHQVLLVPHYAGSTNAELYHWHAVINIKSYINGKTLYDKFSTYKEICDYLNQSPYTHWKYRYHTYKHITPHEYF